MAGVKIERAEVRLVSNIWVCVCVCVCVCGGRWGLYFRPAVSSLEQAHTFSVSFGLSPQHYFISHNDCLVNKLSKRKLLESCHF